MLQSPSCLHGRRMMLIVHWDSIFLFPRSRRNCCRIYFQCFRHSCTVSSSLSSLLPHFLAVIVIVVAFPLSARVTAALFRHYCRYFCRIFSQCRRHCCIVLSLLSSLLPHFLIVAAYPHCRHCCRISLLY